MNQKTPKTPRPCKTCLCRACANFQTDNCGEGLELCNICRMEGYTCGTMEHVDGCSLYVAG